MKNFHLQVLLVSIWYVQKLGCFFQGLELIKAVSLSMEGSIEIRHTRTRLSITRC